jgi:hypothetical protein
VSAERPSMSCRPRRGFAATPRHGGLSFLKKTDGRRRVSFMRWLGCCGAFIN